MVDLLHLQEQAFRLLRESGKPCFLRISKTEDCLWVTDLPRRTDFLADVERSLADLGLCCRLDPASRLWHIDLTPATYAAWSSHLPTPPPPFPADESLHEAYALCRLLLAHPAPLADQPLSHIRAILKWLAFPAHCPFPSALHGHCAVLLRQGQPLPYLGGQLLAAWLQQKGASA